MALHGSKRTFATVLNCMDGRVQLGVNEAVRELFGVDYVDTITEAGIVKFLSDLTDSVEAKTALGSIRISIDAHGSRAIAVAAHYGCAGNPCSDEQQMDQVRRAVAFIQGQFPECEVVGLWVGDSWEVGKVAGASSAADQS